MRNENNLTYKEQRFIDLYLFSDDPKLRNNATQCALQVYDIDGDTQEKRENSASSIGYTLLRKTEVRTYIEAKLKEISEEITEDWILKEIRRVYEMSSEKERMNEALKALEMFGKWKAMFTDKQIQTTDGIEEYLKKHVKAQKVNEN